MPQRRLGSSGLEISAIGLGCLTMTGGYSGMPDRQNMITLLHRAVDLEVTFSTPPRSTVRTPVRNSSAKPSGPTPTRS